MLKHIGFNIVRSDEGFTVKLRIFRGFVEYQEGDHIAVIPVSPVMGEPLVRISEATPIIWKEPHSSETIEEQKRQKILQNIVDALKFRKCGYEIVKA